MVVQEKEEMEEIYSEVVDKMVFFLLMLIQVIHFVLNKF